MTAPPKRSGLLLTTCRPRARVRRVAFRPWLYEATAISPR